MTHMALLGLKLGQSECQRGCESNGHPPDPPKPINIQNDRFRADRGTAKESYKKSYNQLPINRLSGPYVKPAAG